MCVCVRCAQYNSLEFTHAFLACDLRPPRNTTHRVHHRHHPPTSIRPRPKNKSQTSLHARPINTYVCVYVCVYATRARATNIYIYTTCLCLLFTHLRCHKSLRRRRHVPIGYGHTTPHHPYSTTLTTQQHHVQPHFRNGRRMVLPPIMLRRFCLCAAVCARLTIFWRWQGAA